MKKILVGLLILGLIGEMVTLWINNNVVLDYSSTEQYIHGYVKIYPGS